MFLHRHRHVAISHTERQLRRNHPVLTRYL
jgi:hypothetical protein